MKKDDWEKRLHTLLKIRLGNYYDQEAKYFGLWTALKQIFSQELQREREIGWQTGYKQCKEDLERKK